SAPALDQPPARLGAREHQPHDSRRPRYCNDHRAHGGTRPGRRRRSTPRADIRYDAAHIRQRAHQHPAGGGAPPAVLYVHRAHPGTLALGSRPMRLPNLLATAKGRLAAFFFLYITEGIPLGFAATAVATQLRRQDVGPAEIGAFVASFYLPWAFKWAFGPLVDVFASERLGRRRGWIIGTQILMAATLL